MSQILIDHAVPQSWIESLETATGLSVASCPGDPDTSRDQPEALLEEVQVMFCTLLPKNHAVMSSLKLVQLCSASFSQVENLGLPKRGIRVCNASGVNDVPIAEWAVAMMVNLARDLPAMFRNQQAGAWDRDARFQREIRGRTLGIWGYGGIGRETARLAKAMGLRVHVLTRSGAISPRNAFTVEGTGDSEGTLPDRVFSSEQRDAFCSDLDFLLLAMPLTPQNRGLVDRNVFESLPDHAIFLNPARGPLAVEDDLLWALRSGKIAGAALDTHFHYPMPADHPLWSMPNVIMTPHISGSALSPHFATRLWSLFCDNLTRWRDGQALLNELPSRSLEPK